MKVAGADLSALTRDLAALRPGSETAFRVGTRRVIVRRTSDGRFDVLRRGGYLVTLRATTAEEAAVHALGRRAVLAEDAARRLAGSVHDTAENRAAIRKSQRSKP